MGVSSRRVMFFIYMVTLYLTSFCMASPCKSDRVQEKSLGVLKYEVNEVYVGSLKHVIEIANRSPVLVRGELFVPLVKNETSRRYVILHNVSSSREISGSIMSDNYGNMYFCLNDLEIPGKQTFITELNYHVLSFNTHYLVNSSIVGNYDTNADLYRTYTSPEELIECDHSEIASFSQSLVDDVADWHGKVFRIYNFVHGHIRYDVQDEERGALWAFKKGIGDCSEYSYLFVALCRAAGIPARIKAGFAFHHATETLEDGHMWAEYYLENYGWVPVDVTWQQLDGVDDKHFSSIQSVPELMGYANFFFDCKPEDADLKDEQSVSLRPCSTNVFSDSLVESVVMAVQKVSQAKSVITVGGIFGTTLIFPLEAREVEQRLLESRLQLQKAVSFLEEDPENARLNVRSSLESAEEILQVALMLVVKVFALFITISIAVMLLALLLLKKHEKRAEEEDWGRSFIYMSV